MLTSRIHFFMPTFDNEIQKVLPIQKYAMSWNMLLLKNNLTDITMHTVKFFSKCFMAYRGLGLVFLKISYSCDFGCGAMQISQRTKGRTSSKFCLFIYFYLFIYYFFKFLAVSLMYQSHTYNPIEGHRIH